MDVQSTENQEICLGVKSLFCLKLIIGVITPNSSLKLYDICRSGVLGFIILYDLLEYFEK